MDALPQKLMEEVRNRGVDIADNHEAKGKAAFQGEWTDAESEYPVESAQ